MAEPIICPHCGYKNVQHQSICHKCGKRLDEPPSEENKSEVHKINNQTQEVIVKDIHMGFGSMVTFMVKWAIASIPAFLILFILGVIFWTMAISLFIHK